MKELNKPTDNQLVSGVAWQIANNAFMKATKLFRISLAYPVKHVNDKLERGMIDIKRSDRVSLEETTGL